MSVKSLMKFGVEKNALDLKAYDALEDIAWIVFLYGLKIKLNLSYI